MRKKLCANVSMEQAFCRTGCFLVLFWMAGYVCAAEPVLRPEILERKPHDPEAFTQGLVIDGKVWLESTGRYGKSELREVDRKTGKVLRKKELPETDFGEGLVLLEGRIYQLTWQKGVCRVWDRKTFNLIREFKYPGEGWGITTDGKWLYVSDGTPVIRVFNPENFKEIRRFRVMSESGPVDALNELEWVEGEIWANIFETGLIVRFRPRDGKVTGFVDLRELPILSDRHPDQDVLNGIARDPENGAIWVTGKLWTAVYRIGWPPDSP